MLFNDQKGLGLIETLIAVSVFCLGFLALSAVIWSSVGNVRNAWFCDEAVMAGQDAMERLSVIGLEAVQDAAAPEESGNQKIVWDVFDPVDVDGDGNPDFKTIVLRVYHSDDERLSDDELRMQACYRRPAY